MSNLSGLILPLSVLLSAAGFRVTGHQAPWTFWSLEVKNSQGHTKTFQAISSPGEILLYDCIVEEFEKIPSEDTKTIEIETMSDLVEALVLVASRSSELALDDKHIKKSSRPHAVLVISRDADL